MDMGGNKNGHFKHQLETWQAHNHLWDGVPNDNTNT